MKKFFIFVLILISAIAVVRYCNHKNLNTPEIGKGWVDNIIYARERIAEAQSTDNAQLYEINKDFLKRSITYYHETLEHSTKKERQQIQAYLNEQAKKHNTTPNELLKY